MRRVLPLKFFQRPVLTIAPALLGKVLVRRVRGKEVAALITEVEAYDGFKDKACHAHRRKTPRNAPMFDSGGTFYVYLVYGMHWMLNIVTGEEWYPAAVLIRGALLRRPEVARSALEERHKSVSMLRGSFGAPQHDTLEGPGKLTKALKIDEELNGKRAHPGSGLWFEDWGMQVPVSKIKRTPRIGVQYAGEWAEKPYRFLWRVGQGYPCPTLRVAACHELVEWGACSW